MLKCCHWHSSSEQEWRKVKNLPKVIQSDDVFSENTKPSIAKSFLRYIKAKRRGLLNLKERKSLTQNRRQIFLIDSTTVSLQMKTRGVPSGYRHVHVIVVFHFWYPIGLVHLCLKSIKMLRITSESLPINRSLLEFQLDRNKFLMFIWFSSV